MADDKKAVLIDVQIDNAQAIKNIAATRKEIIALKKEQSGLNTETEEGSKRFAEIDQQIKAYNKDIQANQKLIQNEIKLQNENSDSLQSLKAELSNLTAEYNKLSKVDREGVIGDNLKKQILETTNALKSAEQGIGNYRRSIGEYENAVTKALSTGNPFVDNLINIAKQGGTTKDVMTAAAGGVKTLGAAFKALLANPIVLVIAAVVAIFAKLISVIKGNEEQFKKLQQAMAPLQAIGDIIIKVFERLADGFIAVFGWVTKLISAFTDFIGITENLSEVTEAYIQLEKDKANLLRETRKLNEEAAQSEQDVADLRAKIAEKDKYTNEERLKMLEDAIRIETEIAEKRKALAEENLRILEEQAKRTKSSTEEEEALSKARIEVINATTNLANRTRRLNSERANTIKAIEAEGKAEQKLLEERKKAVQDAELQLLEYRRQISDEQNKLTETTLKNDFLIQQEWNKKKFDQQLEYEYERLDLQLQFGRITQSQYQQQLEFLLIQEKTFQNAQLKNLNEYHDAQRKELLRLIDEDTDIQIAEITKKYKDAINAIEAPEPVRLAGQSEEDYLNSPEYKNYQDFLLKKYMYEVALEKELQAEIERINENSLSNRIKKIEDEVNGQYAGDLAKFADNEAEKTRIEIEAFQKTQEEKRAELDKFFEEGKISQEKYNAEIYAMDAELRALISKQALNNYNIELLQSNLTARQRFEVRKEYLEKEMEIYEGNTQKQLELQAELAEAEQDYMEEKIRLFTEWSNTVMELITSISEINMNNQQRELQEYEESKEKEKQALKKQYDSGVISKKQYDAQIEKLDQELDKKRAELEIKQAKRQKALAIFDATLKAAQAILNALNTQPFVPLGLASAVTAGILTAAQIASIASQPLPKASKGMLIQGASHANGGVAIEAEGGEAIINKHSTAMFAPLLSAINQAGGGVPFIPNISDGGYAQRTIINNNSIDENKLAKSIIKGMRDVKIYTSIEEVREADSNFSTITEKDID